MSCSCYDGATQGEKQEEKKKQTENRILTWYTLQESICYLAVLKRTVKAFHFLNAEFLVDVLDYFFFSQQYISTDGNSPFPWKSTLP